MYALQADLINHTVCCNMTPIRIEIILFKYPKCKPTNTRLESSFALIRQTVIFRMKKWLAKRKCSRFNKNVQEIDRQTL